ncbi:hypothetical protein XELAEV_18012661mg [Xenopus laevis]|uniref:Uncharacterized protein n=1 Tax=Xenopus laevis TaxID=8355 RepID=A0A974DQR2_XENLA|nr:hypothetical protein XELAEV_18012661mg [Xenopus laevis]
MNNVWGIIKKYIWQNINLVAAHINLFMFVYKLPQNAALATQNLPPNLPTPNCSTATLSPPCWCSCTHVECQQKVLGAKAQMARMHDATSRAEYCLR